MTSPAGPRRRRAELAAKAADPAHALQRPLPVLCRGVVGEGVERQVAHPPAAREQLGAAGVCPAKRGNPGILYLDR